MTLVVDASVVVSAFVDTGPAGQWAEACLLADDLVAPHLLPAEVTNALRRLAGRGAVGPALAHAAVADVDDLPMALVPFGPFAPRVWELRETVTSYDAWYVALAESLDCDLATRDHRLAGAPGPRCAFVTP